MTFAKRILFIFIVMMIFATVFIPVAKTSYADGETYAVSVYCSHADFTIDKHIYSAGDIVEIKLGKVTDGYVIDHVLAKSGDEIIPVKVKDDVASFIMPDGDVEVTVTFMNSDDVKKTLTTKEIVAISVTGAVVLVAVGYFVFWKLKNKKKSS